MYILKNITLVGGSGSLGSVILQKLQESGRFSIQVLQRPSSTAAFPSDIKIIRASLESPESLAEALRGQDAVISALGTSQVPQQEHLVTACLQAGVRRLIPAEFGADLENPLVRSLPVYEAHCKVRDAIIKAAETSSLTYTFVHNGVFLDWGMEHGFVFGVKDDSPVVVDGGDTVCSATTMASVADAVVGILDHPAETENRPIYIEDIKLSQNRFYHLAKQAIPSGEWRFRHVTLDAMTAEADDKVGRGDLSEPTLVPYLYRAVLDPALGGNFGEVDNALLGLKGMTEEQVVDMVKGYAN